MREPVSGHEVVKKKRDCNNLEKETAGLEKEIGRASCRERV